MSYRRVQVAESQLSWSETMKVFRKSVEPALFLKTIAAIRQEVIADTGMQTWIYHGPVKASG